MLPQILIIDDQFGRVQSDGTNPDRAQLCTSLQIQDVTRDEWGNSWEVVDRTVLSSPICEAVFCRGQTPKNASLGDTVRNSMSECIRAIQTRFNGHGIAPWSLILLDLCFLQGKVESEDGVPAGEKQDRKWESYFGLEVLQEINSRFPGLPVVILSSTPREDSKAEFNRRGALGFIDRTAKTAIDQLKRVIEDHALLPDAKSEILGNSLPILAALRSARRFSMGNLDVMIRGERGTGKELFSRFINRHRANRSGDQNRPFVAINSGNFAPELFQSELFGIAPNVASGIAGRIGLIDVANEGDLFFDEVGDMPPEIQAALLRFLETREVHPVGDLAPHKVDVRVISATEIAIEDLGKGFRRSLGDRFGPEEDWIWLPPLRDREGDIMLLADLFLRKAESTHAGRKREFLPESISVMLEYDWPGNIRELKRRTERAVRIRPDADFVTLADLGLDQVQSRSQASAFSPPSVIETTRELASEFTLDELLDQMANFRFSSDVSTEAWFGKLPKLQAAYWRVLAHLIQTAINAHRRPTAEDLAGEIQYLPIFKLLVGNSSRDGKEIKAPPAADAFKRLLKEMPKEFITTEIAELHDRCKSTRRSRKNPKL